MSPASAPSPPEYTGSERCTPNSAQKYAIGRSGVAGPVGRRTLEVGADDRLDRVDALQQVGVRRGAGERLQPGLAEQPDRVLAAALPAHRVDRREELVAAGRP